MLSEDEKKETKAKLEEEKPKSKLELETDTKPVTLVNGYPLGYQPKSSDNPATRHSTGEPRCCPESSR